MDPGEKKQRIVEAAVAALAATPRHQLGLRCAVVAFCDAKRVKLAQVWPRKEDPDDAEFIAAFDTAKKDAQ